MRQAQLLADADRFYLILDRDPAAGSTNGTRAFTSYNNFMLRTQKVNGPLYAFDRGTGKRLWCYGDGLLENQWLVLEQFADLPVIIAAAPMMQRRTTHDTDPPGGGDREGPRPAAVRQAGDLRQQNFMNLTVDHKNGTIDLNATELPHRDHAGRAQERGGPVIESRRNY